MRGTRTRVTATALALAIACTAAAPAGAAGATGIRGKVLDETCYGPCVVDGAPPPRYLGEDAKVTVLRSGKGHDRVAAEFAENGRFRFELEPGSYVVKVRIASSGPDTWSRDRVPIEIDRGERERVTLRVANSAVL